MQFNFANSGTSPRLGKLAQKEYSTFLEGLSPGNVRSGEPKTFSWIDGAGRDHMVTGLITIAPVHQYELIETQLNLADVNGLIDQAIESAGTAIKSTQAAGKAYAAGCVLCFLWPPSCGAADGAGDKAMGTAYIEMAAAYKFATAAEQGLKENLAKPKPSTSKGDTGADIICYIKEITHNRTVSSYQFQFHMGGPVKGMRGDVDEPTFYPPVQSSATASFQGKGDIHPQKPEHDVSLIKVE